MAYIKTIWENEPSESTPINATNLNKIEDGIYNNSIAIDTINSSLTNLTTYSSNEIDTGKKWIDNKSIYMKVFYIQTLPNNDTLTTTYTISNLDWVTAVYGSARNKTNHNNVFPINNIRPQTPASSIGAYFDTYLKIETGNDRSGFEAYVVVEYTKSS